MQALIRTIAVAALVSLVAGQGVAEPGTPPAGGAVCGSIVCSQIR